MRAASHGVEVEYETFGTRDHPALLLIAGYAMQLIFWDVELCEMLAERGLYVIRFDNRDCGLSTHLGSEPYPVVQAMADRLAGREPPPAPYSLVDMADDGFAVLDAEGIDDAHVIGASMGGVIAQVMAIERPERVRSLVSIMSSTGEPDYGQGTPATLVALLGPPPTDRAQYVEHMLRIARAAGTKTHVDEARTAPGHRRRSTAPSRRRDRRGSSRPCRRRRAATTTSAPSACRHSSSTALRTRSSARQEASEPQRWYRAPSCSCSRRRAMICRSWSGRASWTRSPSSSSAWSGRVRRPATTRRGRGTRSPPAA